MRSLASSSFRCAHHHINRGYTHTSFVVYFEDNTAEELMVSNRALADWTIAKMNQVQETLRQAAARGDTATLAAIDPFFEIRANRSWEQYRA